MSVDEETHRIAQPRVRDLDEVIADFDSRGVGLRSSDNLSRAELYDEAYDTRNWSTSSLRPSRFVVESYQEGMG